MIARALYLALLGWLHRHSGMALGGLLALALRGLRR